MLCRREGGAGGFGRRHLAAAEGCYAVVQWLLYDAQAKPNAIDRFGRTPLEDAVPPRPRRPAPAALPPSTPTERTAPTE